MTDAALTLQDFRALLRLQEADSAIDRLRHRREHLPAHGDLVEMEAQLAASRPALEEATAARDALVAQQARLEAEVQAVEQRIATINGRLYGSVAVAPKDAQAMTEEVAHLDDRRRGLEDEELAVMEALEPAESVLADLLAAARALGDRIGVTRTEIAEAQTAIDGELVVALASRDEVAEQVPGVLVTQYERLRPATGGVAVAAVIGGACGGCHLALAASELDRIRKAPEDAVIRCGSAGASSCAEPTRRSRPISRTVANGSNHRPAARRDRRTSRPAGGRGAPSPR